MIIQVFWTAVLKLQPPKASTSVLSNWPRITRSFALKSPHVLMEVITRHFRIDGMFRTPFLWISGVSSSGLHFSRSCPVLAAGASYVTPPHFYLDVSLTSIRLSIDLPWMFDVHLALSPGGIHSGGWEISSHGGFWHLLNLPRKTSGGGECRPGIGIRNGR